jgi:hypothetical protein
MVGATLRHTNRLMTAPVRRAASRDNHGVDDIAGAGFTTQNSGRLRCLHSDREDLTALQKSSELHLAAGITPGLDVAPYLPSITVSRVSLMRRAPRRIRPFSRSPCVRVIQASTSSIRQTLPICSSS